MIDQLNEVIGLVNKLAPSSMHDNDGDFIFWMRKPNKKAHKRYMELLKEKVVTEKGGV